MGSNKEGPAIQTGKGDINFSVLQNDKNSDNSLAVTDYMVIPSGNYSNNLNNAVKGLKSSTALVVPEMPRNLSLFNLDIKDKGDYIFQAANQISLGQQCEANGNYHMAFNYFRTGVGILLTGVQCKYLGLLLAVHIYRNYDYKYSFIYHRPLLLVHGSVF